jgi:hypothetical protein
MRYRYPKGAARRWALPWSVTKTNLPSGHLARLLKVRAHGLVSVMHYKDGLRRPLVWFQNEDKLGVCAANGDQAMAPELREIVKWYLGEFFFDIAAIDPELSRLNERKSCLN